MAQLQSKLLNNHFTKGFGPWGGDCNNAIIKYHRKGNTMKMNVESIKLHDALEEVNGKAKEHTADAWSVRASAKDAEDRLDTLCLLYTSPSPRDS